MAVVKIHQIKSTLTNAIAYITNASKTDSQHLVSTFECAPPQDPRAVANDFLLVQQEADLSRTTGKPPTVVGVHVIQSFKPGETTARTAHEIGKEFANQITGGEHQWVLATHTDRGHIHNHLIFNPVSMQTLKRYRTPRNKLAELRAISDNLCATRGLHVIDQPSGREPAPSLADRYLRVRGASAHDTLRSLIDQATAKAISLPDLVQRLEDAGVEVTFKGRNMLMRDTHSMTRPIRAWRLGPGYSESNLAARLGRTPVTTFTAAPSMVHTQGIDEYKVAIPKLPGYFLTVPAAQMVNHGNTWHIHLPTEATTPVVDRAGTYQVAFTPEQLCDWFTPLTPDKVIDPLRDQPLGRGKTDAQRRYFASIDRRASNLADQAEIVNIKAELSRLSPDDRKHLTNALRTQETLKVATLQQLFIKQDEAPTPQNQTAIRALQQSIADHQKTLKILTEQQNPKKGHTR